MNMKRLITNKIKRKSKINWNDEAKKIIAKINALNPNPEFAGLNMIRPELRLSKQLK